MADNTHNIFASLSPYFDGNILDILSFICSIFYAFHKWRKASPARKLICKETGVDIANGVGIFPLFVLATTIFSSFALAKLLEANKIILSVAGVVALLAILEE